MIDKSIRGKQIALRPVAFKDRKMIFEWGHNSDIAHLFHLADGETETFETWCEDWKDYYFTDDSPELGRLYLILHEELPVGVIAYNSFYPKNRVELDIWMSCEANCGKGYGPDAIETLCDLLRTEYVVRTFMMQPSARNPRAIRAYEKAGFVRREATYEEIAAEWGGVDQHDSVLMIREFKEKHKD